MRVRPLVTLLVSLAVGGSPAFANALTISDPDAVALFGTSQISTSQQTGGAATLAATTASIGMDAMRNVSGNLGVNVGAGALNAQANQIALLSASSSDINTQQDVHAAGSINGSGAATLAGGTLGKASGNIGVNLVSGVGNAQSNALAVHY
ncbi:hypothetical protein [Paraburkholderia sp. DHOC27]|uniref:hypothetical protein n=1 Tax=Paraburkholderia sp. DHOC27 TaxID=2303330 RepID=UPI000E3C4975|nr:hypothetical protein [Paraburkholderia sp. DHOC27]RFU46824.1 hypothetical protein D0B32_17715 [Paraburkholderia sp. DHOC27]